VAGGVTQNIYVGVATKNARRINRSTDGDSDWSALAGQPLTECGGTGIMPTKAAIEPVSGTMYVTYGMASGPYDDEKGEIWKYNISSATWTNINPLVNDCQPHGGGNIFFGFNGLSVNKSNPNVLMVTGTQLLVAGHLHLPQHQRWRDLDKHLALDALSELCLRDRLPTRHHDVAIAIPASSIVTLVG
jgi:hypothetical protein